MSESSSVAGSAAAPTDVEEDEADVYARTKVKRSLVSFGDVTEIPSLRGRQHSTTGLAASVSVGNSLCLDSLGFSRSAFEARTAVDDAHSATVGPLDPLLLMFCAHAGDGEDALLAELSKFAAGSAHAHMMLLLSIYYCLCLTASTGALAYAVATCVSLTLSLAALVMTVVHGFGTNVRMYMWAANTVQLVLAPVSSVARYNTACASLPGGVSTMVVSRELVFALVAAFMAWHVEGAAFAGTWIVSGAVLAVATAVFAIDAALGAASHDSCLERDTISTAEMRGVAVLFFVTLCCTGVVAARCVRMQTRTANAQTHGHIGRLWEVEQRQGHSLSGVSPTARKRDSASHRRESSVISIEGPCGSSLWTVSPRHRSLPTHLGPVVTDSPSGGAGAIAASGRLSSPVAGNSSVVRRQGNPLRPSLTPSPRETMCDMASCGSLASLDLEGGVSREGTLDLFEHSRARKAADYLRKSRMWSFSRASVPPLPTFAEMASVASGPPSHRPSVAQQIEDCLMHSDSPSIITSEYVASEAGHDSQSWRERRRCRKSLSDSEMLAMRHQQHSMIDAQHSMAGRRGSVIESCDLSHASSWDQLTKEASSHKAPDNHNHNNISPTSAPAANPTIQFNAKLDASESVDDLVRRLEVGETESEGVPRKAAPPKKAAGGGGVPAAGVPRSVRSVLLPTDVLSDGGGTTDTASLDSRHSFPTSDHSSVKVSPTAHQRKAPPRKPGVRSASFGARGVEMREKLDAMTHSRDARRLRTLRQFRSTVFEALRQSRSFGQGGNFVANSIVGGSGSIVGGGGGGGSAVVVASGESLSTRSSPATSRRRAATVHSPLHSPSSPMPPSPPHRASHTMAPEERAERRRSEAAVIGKWDQRARRASEAAVGSQGKGAPSTRAFVSYEKQLADLWELVSTSAEDPQCSYLCEADVLTLLELCGVVVETSDLEDFFVFALEDSWCSYLAFCAAFEDFRCEGLFRGYHSRPKLAAICAASKDNTLQLRVQRACDEYACDGGLSRTAVAAVLKRFDIPCDDADISHLFDECCELETLDVPDVVSLFSCTHFCRDADAWHTPEMLAVRHAVNRNMDKEGQFRTEQQVAYDRAITARTKAENKVWVPCIYCLLTFCIAVAETAFGVRHEGSGVVVVVYILTDIIYAVWAATRALSPIDDAGQIVTNKTLILKAYAQSTQFVVDLIVLFPLDLVGMIFAGGLSRHPAFRLNKCLAIVHYNTLFDTTVQSLRPLFVRVVKALVALLVEAHLISCLFKVVADDVGDESTALILSNFQNYSNRPFATQYLQAYDYSLKTMSGLSRGQPMPVDDLQHMMAIVAVLSGVAAYAYFLSTISTALQAPSQESMFKAKMDHIASSLAYYSLPSEFSDTCMQYYRHVFKSSGSDTLDDTCYLHDLPEELQILARIVTCKNVLSKVPIFQEAVGDGEFVYALALKLRTEVIIPGQVVTQKGTPGSSMYFITHGEFVLVDDKGEAVLTLRSGNFFGEIALLHSVRRTATIKAAQFCNVLRLEKHDFEEVAELFPDALMVIQEAAKTRIQRLIKDERSALAGKRREADHDDDEEGGEKINDWLSNRRSEESDRNSPRNRSIQSSSVADFVSEPSPTSTDKPFVGMRLRMLSEYFELGDGSGSLN